MREHENLPIHMLPNTYNVDKILLEIDQIVSKFGWSNHNQISLQSPDGDFHSGVGAIEETPQYNEHDFSKLNINPRWEISRFIIDHGLYRTRIMKLAPRVCYSVHADRSKRIHLAITTNENCFIMIDRKLYNVPDDGHAYLVDTTKPHSAMNCNLGFYRIHIVGCVD